jgi:hypothetical protein
MSDEETSEPAEDPGPQDPEPQSEEAYPALELDQLRESDRGERAGWRSLDEG